MPKVYNFNYGPKPPPGAVYIGRGSNWGNPYKIGVHGDRDDVCNQFRDVILPTLNVEELRGKDLVCYCAPLRCHGDDILRKANKRKMLRRNIRRKKKQ